MTDETEQNTREDPEEMPELGLVLRIFYWFLLWKAGGASRDRRREKGLPPPSKGICGPINHDENGRPWLWLEITTVRGYPMMSRNGRMRVKASFEAAIKSFSDWHGGGELDIQVQAVPYDLDAIDDSLKAGIVNANTASKKVLERHAKSRLRTRKHIEKWNLKERRVFIGVKLSDERQFVERMLSQLTVWMGFSAVLANGFETEIYKDQIEEVVAKFENNNIEVRELTGKEVARVIQRCVYRGQKQLPELADDTGVVRSMRDLSRLTDSRARDHGNMIEIIGDEGNSYATYLGVAKLPDEFYYSWLFVGDNQQKPVEVSARLQVQPIEKTSNWVGTTLLVVENSLKHLHKSKGDKDQEIYRRNVHKRLGLTAQKRVNKEVPWVKVDAFLVVSGDTPESVKRNSRYVAAKCRGKGVILEVDEAYQGEIRRQCYPGSRRTYDRYQQWLFSDGMAQSMPHGATIIGNGGDLQGIVRGHGAESAPFLYSHRAVLTMKVDTKTGQVFIGPSGEGKTDAMINRAISDAEANMAAFVDEGKGDSTILKDELSLLADMNALDLSDPSLAGLLNPLFLGDNPKESRDLTLNVLMKCVSSEAKSGWRSFVAEAIDNEFEEVEANPKLTLDLERIVKQRLRNAPDTDPDALTKRAIGRSIMGLLSAEHSDVIFAPGKPWQEVADKYIRRGQVTFVVYGHLTPPDSDKRDEDLSEQERLALMVRDLVNVVYYRIAMDTDIPLAIYKDEIQIDKRMGGSVSSEHLSRIGRSKGVTISLGGQFIGDVPIGFWENTATMNFFRFTTDESAETAIKLLRINVKDDTEEGKAEKERLINLLLDVPNNGRNKYEVIVRTHDGQIGLVRFMQIYHEGRFVSNTEAVEERRRQERMAKMVEMLPLVRRAETAEEAEEALVLLGVPPEVVSNPNGHHVPLEQWKSIVQSLEDDERVVLMDGKLQVVQGVNTTAPQLPLLPAGEAKTE
jgi:hypothetical protein